jgi:hypothetical protein
MVYTASMNFSDKSARIISSFRLERATKLIESDHWVRNILIENLYFILHSKLYLTVYAETYHHDNTIST